MNYEIVNLQEKVVEGIAARTNNHEPDMGAIIGGLWHQFYADGIYERIQDKTDGKAIGLYTDYAGDVDDDYTVMVCYAVEHQPEHPQYETRRIPAGPYAKFVIQCDMRTSSEEISKAWQEIWKMDLPRAYLCDFEEYQNDDMEHAEIHFYIGLKNALPEQKPKRGRKKE